MTSGCRPKLSLAILTLLLSACTTTVDGFGGIERHSWHIGIVRVGYREAARFNETKIDTLGLWTGLQGSSGLGFHHRSTLSIPNDCRLVVILREGEDPKRLEALLASYSQGDKEPCIVSDGQ